MKIYLVIVLSMLLSMVLSSQVALASTAITLINGDTLQGNIIKQENGTVTFRHSVLGELLLQDDQIAKPASLNADNIDITESQDKKANVAPQRIAVETTREASPGWLLPNWQRQLDIGVSGADGNSQSQNIHTALNAKTESSDRRWSIQAAYDSSEEGGNKSRDEFFTQANRDWLIPDSPYFYFSSGRFDWDDFQDWDYRLNLAGGVGKDFIQRQDWTLRGKTGLGLNREFGGEDDSISPEGLIELASAWQLSDDHKIELITTFYPQLDELKEFRNITSLAWVNKLNGAMRLKVELTNEHDTDVPDEVKKNDFKYATSLSWDL